MRTSNIVQKGQSSREVGPDATAMSIDEASSVFLMDALGKLYSRPAQAVLREYLSNAVDAHKAKGGKLPPIKVSLPAHIPSAPYSLSIRDFGNGMNEEQFRSILSRYGASTKRDSNVMIGGFGLGAKSGFAVSDEFFMTSYQQGKGLCVRIFKDSRNQGYIEFKERFSTTEPDGLLVEVPIPEGNLSELASHALDSKIPFFLGYAPDEVEVSPDYAHAMESVHNPASYTPLELGGQTIGWLGKNPSMAGNVFALIGKVSYRIDVAQLARSHKLDKELMEVLPVLTSFGRNHVINVPIGSVDMPSAREEITYSERSLKTLSAVLCKYALLVKQSLQKTLNAQDTRLKALDFLVQLESTGYSDTSSLSWKGQSFNDDFFDSSPMRCTLFSQGDYGLYGLRTESASRMTFCKLRELSNKDKHSFGIFKILVDNDRDIDAVQHLFTQDTLKAFLNINSDTKYTSSNKAWFIVTTKDDVLNDWVISSTPLEVSALAEAEETEKREQALREKRKAELAQAQKVRQEALEIALANTMLSDFHLRAGGNHPTRHEIDYFFNDSQTKYYYWSEEEVNKFATASQGLRKIAGNGLFDNRDDKKPLLFPFIATDVPNTFYAVVETKNYVTTNYLVQLRFLLRLFFDVETDMIIVGKDRNLEEFKAAYPQLESGVLKMKELIESEVDNKHSRVMIVCSAINSAIDVIRDKSELQSLTKFINALSPSQKDELSPEIVDAEKRFSTILHAADIAMIGEKYLFEIMQAFVPHTELSLKTYSIREDIAGVRAKYPLLVQSTFNKYSPEVINHLLEYIKLCAKR